VVIVMSKESKRTPTWKIIALAAGCAVGAVVLFALGSLSDRWLPDADSSTEKAALVDLPVLLSVVAAACVLVSAIAVVWLILRIRADRTPAWQKNVDRFGEVRKKKK
jgi:multisubunit Na+/H+ antiporter MnhE subunit